MHNFTKNWKPTRSPEASAKFAERVNELRESLLLLDPNLVAARSGAAYLTLGPGRGELHIPFWGNICILSWPELTGYGHLIEPQPLSDFQLAFLFHHLLTADGTPVSGQLGFVRRPPRWTRIQRRIPGVQRRRGSQSVWVGSGCISSGLPIGRGPACRPGQRFLCFPATAACSPDGHLLAGR